MDLVHILRTRIDGVEEGAYTPGLRATLQHVQVAANHLKRGAEAPDDTAFTDAIYRTNQAFEGSLKEAYRVLAGKDPAGVRPYDIETFLQGQGVLRERVVDQMSRYRTAWRNPSTHDYKLEFDEDEALLAIVTVCAFAIVLVDQIAEKVSFERAKAAAPKVPPPPESRSLADVVADRLMTFSFTPGIAAAAQHGMRDAEMLGAIGGHLDAVLPEGTTMRMDAPLGGGASADLVVERAGERVLLEVKRTRFPNNVRGPGISQLSRYIAVSGIREGILFMCDEESQVSPSREDYPLPGVDGRIIIIGALKRGSS